MQLSLKTLFHGLKIRFSKDHWPLFFIGNLSNVANLILPIVLVRILAPAEMGIYKTFFLYLNLIPFLTMAGGALHSVYYWAGKGESASEYLRYSWLVTNLLSFFFFIPGAIVLFFFRHHFALEEMQLYLLLFCAILVCPSSHYTEAKIAQGKLVQGALLALFFEIVKVIGFVFIAWKYQSSNHLFTFFFAMMVGSFALMTYLGYRDQLITFKWDRSKIKEVLVYSLPLSLSSTLLFIIEKADQLILSIFLLPETFAFYTLGSLGIPPLYLLEAAVQKKLIPKLSMLYEQKNLKEMQAEYKQSIAHISHLVIPALFGLFYFAEEIITLLYTSEYVESAYFLKAFAFSYLLLMLPHDSLFRATGKTNFVLKIYLYLTPFSILTIFLMAKYTSAIYCLIAGLVVKFLFKLYCLYLSANIIETNLMALIPFKKILGHLLVASLLTFLCHLVRNQFPSEMLWFLICAPLFAAFYLLFFMFAARKAIRKIS